MSASSEDLNLPLRAASGVDPSRQADLKQMFVLIEGILPFEACLYYQVIPLSLEGSCLNLGMVNPDDQAAADYVRRIVSYINCSIAPRPIPSDWHRETLSKFLSHAAKSRKSTPQPGNPHESPTLVVSPNDLRPSSAAPAVPPSEPAAPKVALDLPLRAQKQSFSSLRSLSPKALLQELLSRVVTEGIGRLYFERQERSGRILWSKDGVLQSVLEQVDPLLLQGTINELKLMMRLSLIPVRKTKQAEIERIHNQQRILLRLRVMPGSHGEEATLQVLRGAALRFYQQQQIEKLSRDALDLAHTLQQRLSKIREQARQHLEINATSLQAMPAISALLQQMEQQLQELMPAAEEADIDDEFEDDG
ncbi:MAG: hypothetical protein F6J97_19815 [Leptolyngbya sp. SIO4C1]|nr:hypothetical protein [Leptolyngbya sp. SIO4C1]